MVVFHVLALLAFFAQARLPIVHLLTKLPNIMGEGGAGMGVRAFPDLY
jgi:hypothetical protein